MRRPRPSPEDGPPPPSIRLPIAERHLSEQATRELLAAKAELSDAKIEAMTLSVSLANAQKSSHESLANVNTHRQRIGEGTGRRGPLQRGSFEYGDKAEAI